MKTDLIIFYVDDDVDDLDFFTGVANDINRDIIVVTHDRGHKLITALDNPPPSPNIIFLDLNMPGLNGFDVLKELRQKEALRNIPIVIFSTAKDDESVLRSWKLGANLYLQKASSFDSFKKSLQYVFNLNWNTSMPTFNDFMYSH